MSKKTTTVVYLKQNRQVLKAHPLTLAKRL